MFDELKLVLINNFKAARYVSSIEACDKIFGFKRIYMSHTIYRLSLHLENEQPVVFTEDTVDEVAERATNRHTMLTGWFHLNRIDTSANNMLYMEILMLNPNLFSKVYVTIF